MNNKDKVNDGKPDGIKYRICLLSVSDKCSSLDNITVPNEMLLC